MAEGYVTAADGVRLFFETRGNGPQVVVFPNGFYLADEFSYLAEGRTLIFYDPRNRGRSDASADEGGRGVHQDVDDLDAVRRHFGLETFALVGHSYIGTMMVLYAMQHARRVARIVQLSPLDPFPGKSYPSHLTCVDDVLRDALPRLGQLQAERNGISAREFCEKFWSIIRPIYVANPEHADRIAWSRCDLATEVNFMKSWRDSIFPSLQRLALTAEQLARAVMPVLVIHGRRDRSAPYGGARMGNAAAGRATVDG